MKKRKKKEKRKKRHTHRDLNLGEGTPAPRRPPPAVARHMGNRFGRSRRKKGAAGDKDAEAPGGKAPGGKAPGGKAPGGKAPGGKAPGLRRLTPRPSQQWTQSHFSVPRLPEAAFYGEWATRPPASQVPASVCAKSVQAMKRRMMRKSEAHCRHEVCELWKWDRCRDCGVDLGDAFMRAQRTKAEAAEREDLAASGGITPACC